MQRACRFFQNGSCRFGESCNFAHIKEANVNIQPPMETESFNPQNYKPQQPVNNKKCFNFQQGKCQNQNCQ